MAYDSLRPYLDVLEQQGRMRWIDKEVDKDQEIGPVVRMIFRAMSEDDRYGIGFRNIKGFPGGRVVAGAVAASHDMIATALQCDSEPAVIRSRVIEGLRNPIDPVIVESGPCKEVILGSDDVDLNNFPIPTWTPQKDAGPYLTPLWMTKDPDTGRRNVGIRRCQIKGRDRTGVLFALPEGGGATQFAKWRQRGQNMPAAIFIGTDPVHYLIAPSRYGPDEIAVAGGIRGEAVELVKCETVDLEVPATAEIVIEGEILIDTVDPEGPFGEFTGHMAGGGEAPVFRVKCITHRKDPIILGIVSQFPPSESSLIRRVLIEADLMHYLCDELNLSGIADVHILEAGSSLATVWISVSENYAGHVDQVVFGALGHFGMSYFKWIVVTDDDIDINDPFMRDWVMAWRVRPDRDMRIIPDTGPVALDPSSMQPGVARQDMRGAKVVIDARRKWKYPDLSMPPRDLMQNVIDTWDEYELPPLGEVKLPQTD
jgi:UbiD family decarboxylase